MILQFVISRPSISRPTIHFRFPFIKRNISLICLCHQHNIEVIGYFLLILFTVSCQLMFRQQNPGVYFEYYITRNQTINETSAANVTITPLRRHIRHRYSSAPRRTLQKPRHHRGRTPVGRDDHRNPRRKDKTGGQAVPLYPGTPRGRSRGGYPVASPDGSFQPRQVRPNSSPSDYRKTPNTHPPIRGAETEHYPSTYTEGGNRDTPSSGSRNTRTGSSGETYTTRPAPSGSQGNYVSPIPPQLPNRYGRLPNDPRTKGVRVYVVGGEHPASRGGNPASRERLPQPGLPRPGVYPRRKRVYSGNGQSYPRPDGRGSDVSSSWSTRADMSVNQAYWSQFNIGRNRRTNPARTHPTRDSRGNTQKSDDGTRRPVNSFGNDGKTSHTGGGYDRRERGTYPAPNRPDGGDVTPAYTVRPWPSRSHQPSYPRTQRHTIRPPFSLPPYAGPHSPRQYPQHPRSPQRSTPRTYPRAPATPRPYPTQTTARQHPTRPAVTRPYPQRPFTRQPTPAPSERDRSTPLQPTSHWPDKQPAGGAKGMVAGWNCLTT